jgi:lipopolysaccharide biosynthesis glycosyltransferase
MAALKNPTAEPLVVVTACDENYVRGAAAAIRSAIDSVAPWQPVRAFVLDGGITPRSKSRLKRSWRQFNVSTMFLQPDLASIGDMHTSDHVNLSTYLRILMADLLPDDVTRAIYLDADTIVRRDLAELWREPIGDALCVATNDIFHPFLNPREACPRPVHCMQLNTNPEPIPNYRELGLPGTAPYFNAGVMLVNVKLWRQEQFSRQAFHCLRVNAAHVRYWDQYALNVLCSGRWRAVDPRWNQNSHVFRLPGWELTHLEQEDFEQLRQDPWIVHFDYVPKPWDLECKHPFRGDFFRALDRTSWWWWRPRRTVQQRLQRTHQAYRKWRQENWSPVIRSLKERWLGRKRRAA